MERVAAEAIYDQGREVVVAVLLRMDEQIRRLEARVASQDERIEVLERRLSRSSRNSSSPPSVDPRRKKPKRGKNPSGRSQGAQTGHEGHGRELLPLSAVDEVIEHWPERCGCGQVFAAGDLLAVGDPLRHQVEELPVIAAVVIEHLCERVCCPGCGRQTRAALPDDLAASAFGPRLQAAVAALSEEHSAPRAASRLLRHAIAAASASMAGALGNRPLRKRDHGLPGARTARQAGMSLRAACGASMCRRTV